MKAPSHRDRWVSNGAVRLNVRDYGGEGSPVLLIHGAGRSLGDWDGMVPHLLTAHRVASLDLRGHGASSHGPWEWAAVEEDVLAVSLALEFEQPALVGHSLGGMLAARLAAVPERCRVAVNLDGHGTLPTELYVGIAPDDVRRSLSEQESQMRQVLALLPEPTRAATMKMLEEVARLDLFEVYRACRAPLLIVQAQQLTDTDPGSTLARAHRDGTARVLEELAAGHSHIHYQPIDATHALILEQPKTLATTVRAFVAGAGSTG